MNEMLWFSLTYECKLLEMLFEIVMGYFYLQVKVPVIVVGCKLDLRDENQPVSLEQVMSPIMQQFREIETCIECSASKQIQVCLSFSVCLCYTATSMLISYLYYALAIKAILCTACFYTYGYMTSHYGFSPCSFMFDYLSITIILCKRCW